MNFEINAFMTSIWDETLYKAWSSIVSFLIPFRNVLKNDLTNFCQTIGADEVVLFEKSTFLEVSHYNNQDYDEHRFEKISNIIKQFKLSLMKPQFNFTSLVVKNSKFTAYLDEFTNSSYIMVILGQTDVELEAVRLNIKCCKDHFEELLLSN
jgi:Ras-related GTP-binding protein A/B